MRKPRGLLDLALTDRIRFMPNPTQRRYELTIPIAFDRLITAIVPEFQGDLHEMMASPTGLETVCTVERERLVAAA